MDTADIQRQKTIKEIEKMTGSVTMLSEKQIGRMDEQFVQQQLAFETTQERRRNFMEGRGMTLGRAFTKSNARVRNDEPVLQRGETKSQRKLNKKATKMFDARAAQMDAERQEMRDAFAQDAETSFIHARAFASPYQYETLTKAKKWMTDNPGRYVANKAAVDAIYRDLYAASEVYGTYTAKALTYDSLQYDLQDEVKAGRMDRKTANEMQREYDRRAAIEETRQRLVERRLSLLSNALEMLLRGKEYPDMVKEVAREYAPMDYTQSQKDEMRRHAGGARSREDACREGFLPIVREVLKDTYTDRAPEEIQRLAEQTLSEDATNLYLLYREGEEEWNQKLAEKLVAGKVDTSVASKPLVENMNREIVSRYYDTAMANINVEELFSMSDEQLMDNADKLEECGMTGDVVRSMENAKIEYTRNKGSSYREVYRGTRHLDSDAVFLRSALIGQYAKKARMLWYVEAYKMGMLDADLVSRADAGAGIDGGSPQELLAGVKKELAKCNSQIKALKKSYGRA